MIIAIKIYICCMQEIELSKDYNHEILSFDVYSLICETNCVKARIGIYVRTSVNFLRRMDLEHENNGLIILELNFF